MARINEIINISDKIHDLIFKDIVQVNHPSKIEPRVLEGFVDGKNQAHLTLVNGKITTKANLLSINPASIDVELMDDTFRPERDDRVVIVFDLHTYNRTFILQTALERKFFSKLSLKFLDPRFDKRYPFQLKDGLEFYIVPPKFYDLIKNKEVQIIRRIFVDEEGPDRKIAFKDAIYNGVNLNDPGFEKLDLNTDHLHPDFKVIFEKPSKSVSLKDISCGGLCVVLDEELFDNKGLILFKMEASSVNSSDPGINCNSLSLQLLGSIRGVNEVHNKHNIHIAFLKKLSKDFSGPIFSALERHCYHIKKTA